MWPPAHGGDSFISLAQHSCGFVVLGELVLLGHHTSSCFVDFVPQYLSRPQFMFCQYFLYYYKAVNYDVHLLVISNKVFTVAFSMTCKITVCDYNAIFFLGISKYKTKTNTDRYMIDTDRFMNTVSCS